MKAKVTTYQTAVKHGFSFDDFAKGMQDYGNVAIKPKANATEVEFEVYTCDRISAEGQEVIDEGTSLGRENHTLVVATCDCGWKFGAAISFDDASAHSHLTCPDCKSEVSNDKYDVDDSLTWNKLTR